MSHVIVVGAGSAGCVVAARLSEDPRIEVTLIEAGPDYPTAAEAPPDIVEVDMVGHTDHDWGFLTTDGGGAHAGALVVGGAPGTVPLLRGKVVGGCSAINAGNAMRALPADFDRWVALGLPEWNWREALNAFKMLEDDPADGDWHGCGGPFPVRRYETTELGTVHRAFVEASRSVGYSVIADHNAPGAVGVGVIPMNRRGSTRMNAAWTHLTTDVRARRNLTIVAGAEVTRVEIADKRARAVHGNGIGRLEADTIVLAAGAIGSPTLLLRSGIGPSGQLEAAGVPLVADVPGVGRSLREHAATAVLFAVADSMVAPTLPLAQTLLSLSSGLSGADVVDLHLIPLSLSPGTCAIAVGIMRPKSTGAVTLAPEAPHGPPRIHLGLFADPLDRAVARFGVDAARELSRSDALGRLLGDELFPGRGSTGADLEATIAAAPNLYYHACGTCRMAPADDPQGVVDAFGALRGVDGVWVIDASIFPDIPSVPINSTTMMVAGRCAAVLAASLE